MRYLYILILLLPISAWSANDSLWLSGTTDILDTWFNYSSNTVNYGNGDTIVIGASADTAHLMIKTPYLADSIPGGKILKSYTVQLYTKQRISAGVFDVYFIMKPFNEVTATWTSWDYNFVVMLNKQWGIAGCQEPGWVMNSDDESGHDRGDSANGSASHPATGNWVDIAIDTGWINQKWLIAPDSSRGLIFIPRSGDAQLAIYWASEKTGEDSTKSARVKIVWGDEEIPTGPPNVRHGPDGAGQRHGPDGASVRHGP